MPSTKQRITVYLSPEEYEAIKGSASRAYVSLSTFCKKVCLGSPVPSLECQAARMELRRLKADLGRLGGLVKQALAEGADRTLVHRLLRELDARQQEVKDAVGRIR
jgi:hypothetical protein